MESFVRISVVFGIAMIAGWLILGGGASPEDSRDIQVAMNYIGPMRSMVAEHVLATGRLPDTNDDVGLHAPDSYRSGSITGIHILPGGVIAVRFRKLFGIDGAVLLYRPTRTHPARDDLRWDCESNIEDIADFLPRCRYVPVP
ncbi:MAG TPA: pilin [Gammaproteobacteria bacterium]